MWWAGRRPEAAADAAHRLRRTRGTLEPPWSAVAYGERRFQASRRTSRTAAIASVSAQ
jgi:hypothetical protein